MTINSKLFLKLQLLTLGRHRTQFRKGVLAVTKQGVFQTPCIGVQFSYLEAIFPELFHFVF